MLLGCIADDFTGATDLANNLVRNGMRCIQTIGLPPPELADELAEQTDAVVIALKSRTTAPDQAIGESIAALHWLEAAGCQQIYFKYCSTFDSTDQGNIGPVTDALMKAMAAEFTIACPAFPEAGRTIFKGHLFVGDVLLSDSGMKDHPLTPMTDSNLVRVLQRQSAHKVGLIPYDTLAGGVTATQEKITALKSEGIGIAIADALHDADLHTLAQACAGLRLLTAGSGVAIGLPENFRRQGVLKPNQTASTLPAIDGPAVVLSGSCSQATLQQVDIYKQSNPCYVVDPLRAARGEPVVDEAVAMALDAQSQGKAALICASAAPEQVRAIQESLGRDAAGAVVEQTLAACAAQLLEQGTRRFVVAGGETSGAVVNALNVLALRIGPQIDPGVPWTASVGAVPLAITLKSGNFGAPGFFQKALDMLDTRPSE
ncbi:MAG: 3-oxo-tetronate kinase [Burkholderiaceae bacterium]